MLRTLFTNLQKWCFIAGTPVMTMAGPLPIEQIDPGMMVWSAPECGTGQACYRPVLETYRNRAKEVWHVSYDHDADRFTPEETLSASAEHPVWVEETASFLPVADLRPGMTLRMASGYGGTVGGIRSETSRSPAGTPVFNFAVAEHHTYHAGKGGGWVHNPKKENGRAHSSPMIEANDVWFRAVTM